MSCMLLFLCSKCLVLSAQSLDVPLSLTKLWKTYLSAFQRRKQTLELLLAKGVTENLTTVALISTPSIYGKQFWFSLFVFKTYFMYLEGRGTVNWERRRDTEIEVFCWFTSSVVPVVEAGLDL